MLQIYAFFSVETSRKVEKTLKASKNLFGISFFCGKLDKFSNYYFCVLPLYLSIRITPTMWYDKFGFGEQKRRGEKIFACYASVVPVPLE